jgi:DNA-directed RNA polymerase subunit beta'
MMSTNNILSPASGRPIIVPSQDIVLGCYYMTRERPFARGEGMTFASIDEVRAAFDGGQVALQAAITCRVQDEKNPRNPITREKTTVGRMLMWEMMPKGLPFKSVNKVLGKKELGALIDATYRMCGQKETVLLADKLRTTGYTEASKAGISICLDNMAIPAAKAVVLGKAQGEVEQIENQYTEGLITNGERYNKIIDIWAKASEDIAQEMMKNISTEELEGPNGEKKKTASFNPIFIMADSGARGSVQQLRQLAGMRGLMAKPSGEIIETPITANFREGLSVLQYFISTHGARKGLADTALKTANSGYLTRRLVDVAQDAIITEFDCGTLDGLDVMPLIEAGEVIEGIGDRVLGRVALEDVVDPVSSEVIVNAGVMIDEALEKRVEDSGIQHVKIRSVLTCQSKRGICVECYGRDLARGHKISLGEAVGVIAAQSIGEPGTQLTMRTFHIGGAASRRAEASTHENRREGKVRFNNLVVTANKRKDAAGEYTIAMNRNGEIVMVDDSGREIERYNINYGARVYVTEGQRITGGTMLAE